MGGSSHRIEILLIGVVLLLGSAFAAGASLLPHGTPLFAVTLEAEPFASQREGFAWPAPDLRAYASRASAAARDLRAVALARPELAAGAGLLLAVGVVARIVGRRLTLGACARAVRRSARAAAGIAGGHKVRPYEHCRNALHRLRRAALRVATAMQQRATPSPAVAVAPLVVDIATPLPAAPATPGALEVAAIPDEMPTLTLPAARGCSPDELAQAVAAALTREWQARGLRSPVVALDVEAARDSGRARVTLDADPCGERELCALPDHLARANDGWSVRWRGGTLEVVTPPVVAAGAESGPLLVPALQHGRRGRLCRYVTLGWPGARDAAAHMGFYGARAAEALHACMASLLYAYPPEALALAVIERGQMSPLYAAAPHAVALPGSPRAALAALDRALLRGAARGPARRLVLACIDPDETLLAGVARLVARAQEHPGAPLTVLLAQTQLLPQGRELYALLPACITAGGAGDPALLPGRGGWPCRGAARLVIGDQHASGTPHLLGESGVRAALAALAAGPRGLPPVLWDTVATAPPDRAPAPVWDCGLPADAADDPLAARLARAFSGHEASGEAPPVIPSAEAHARSPWPAGPGTMSPAELAALISRILVEPAIIAATPPGLTKRRLAALLPPAARQHAAELMAWLDAAGLLEAPRDESLRWREPRRLRDADPESIAAQLRRMSPGS